jgi:nucleotide-binding universal stress UspA family protein
MQDNIMKHIVVAVDGSGPSLRAVDMAADIAAKFSARLTLLTAAHSVDDRGIEAYAKAEHINDPTEVLQIESARNALLELRDRATAKGARVVETEASLGDAAEQILSYARSGKVDMIVMGNRGHGQLAGLLLGSVTQKVVGLAPCSVLVVH